MENKIFITDSWGNVVGEDTTKYNITFLVERTGRTVKETLDLYEPIEEDDLSLDCQAIECLEERYVSFISIISIEKGVQYVCR